MDVLSCLRSVIDLPFEEIILLCLFPLALGITDLLKTQLLHLLPLGDTNSYLLLGFIFQDFRLQALYNFCFKVVSDLEADKNYS